MKHTWNLKKLREEELKQTNSCTTENAKDDEKKKKIENFNRDIECVEISLSEKSIYEGNAELSQTLKESTLNRKKIMYCQKKLR